MTNKNNNYQQGYEDALQVAREDVRDDNIVEDGPPKVEPTDEDRENAAAEVERQIEEHIAELEHGEADIE